MDLTELSIEKLGLFIKGMKQIYDVVRVIDPQHCQIIDPENGASLAGHCYDVWGKTHRCKECASYRACLTGKVAEKNDNREGKYRHVISMPFVLKLDDGMRKNISIELISAQKEPEQEAVLEKDAEENIENFVIEDITIPPYVAESYRIAKHKERFDDLTGIYNRETFIHEAQKGTASMPDLPRRLVVLKLENIQEIKHKFGASTADEILMTVSDDLRDYCGNGDFYGRVGADRFAALILADRYDKNQFNDCITSWGRYYKRAYNLRFENTEQEIGDRDFQTLLDA